MHFPIRCVEKLLSTVCITSQNRLQLKFSEVSHVRQVLNDDYKNTGFRDLWNVSHQKRQDDLRDIL